jgi:predicted Ser/Thr protein kinase
VLYYVPPGVDEFPDDPESVNYMAYNFEELFIRESESPYFADRLFGNRFMGLINSFDQVVDRNRIYLFEGPPGSGKSTFLKNFLYRFESYMKTNEGEIYDTSWKIDKSLLLQTGQPLHDTIILNCPNHDHPILQIPLEHRKEFLYDLIIDEEFKTKLFSEKKYSWIFQDEPCTICSSLSEALIDLTGSPLDVLNMIYPRRMQYSRRQGEGISVFNPGDIVMKNPVVNPAVQQALDELFGDSNLVKIIHSEYARTNNGIYVVMDVKQHNRNRLLDLHGIVSDGIHKVESIEENINTLYMGLINPQDKEFMNKNPALKDRINTIKMPYILDYKTEVQIYTNILGSGIKNSFLPQILEDFAKVIIASRLSSESEALKEWIGSTSKYRRFCDPQLLLLKMLIYSGIIPEWIGDDDRRSFKAGIRRKILSEAEDEGFQGITGRESIRIFHDFFTNYSRLNKLINMQMLQDFFNKNEEIKKRIPENFLESLVDSYDYTILQQVKESLFFYNRTRIAKDIQNYIFATNFDLGTVEKNLSTGQMIEVTEDFLRGIENFLITTEAKDDNRLKFRREIQQRYISATATELQIEGKKLTQTILYKELIEIYKRNLKMNALDPFKESDSFRSAIKEYNTKDFQSHDKKIRKDVTYLIHKLMSRYNYTENGAKEVCIYVIDLDIAGKFDE